MSVPCQEIILISGSQQESHQFESLFRCQLPDMKAVDARADLDVSFTVGVYFNVSCWSGTYTIPEPILMLVSGQHRF
jgi:hypothetical protein